MARLQGVFPIDFAVTPITNSIGILATGTSSGVIILAKNRLYKVTFIANPTGANILGLRITLGLTTGTVAATPTGSNPLLINYHENVFSTGDMYDSLNLTNLAADNGAISVGYSVIPVSAF